MKPQQNTGTVESKPTIVTGGLSNPQRPATSGVLIRPNVSASQQMGYGAHAGNNPNVGRQNLTLNKQ